MNKAVSQSRANAELARAFERPWRTPHMSMEKFFAKNEQKRSGMRMCGALRELVRAEQRVALFMHVCEQEVMALKYEQKSRANEMSGAICEYFLRIAGVRSTKQSAFMCGGAGEARMGVYESKATRSALGPLSPISTSTSPPQAPPPRVR